MPKTVHPSLVAIRKIQASVQSKVAKHVRKLRKLIASKRGELEELERAVSKLIGLTATPRSKPKAALANGKVRKRKRMSPADIAANVGKLKGLTDATASDIMKKLGLKKVSQFNTIKKAAGSNLSMKGNRRNATYIWKG